LQEVVEHDLGAEDAVRRCTIFEEPLEILFDVRCFAPLRETPSLIPDTAKDLLGRASEAGVAE
jgi:hypothetical protein